ARRAGGGEAVRGRGAVARSPAGARARLPRARAGRAAARAAPLPARARVGAERTLPPGGGAQLEIQAGLAACGQALVSDTVVSLDELLLVGSFLSRPPAELRIVPLDMDAILAAMPRCQTPVPRGNSVPAQPPARERAAQDASLF